MTNYIHLFPTKISKTVYYPDVDSGIVKVTTERLSSFIVLSTKLCSPVDEYFYLILTESTFPEPYNFNIKFFTS